MHECMLLVYDLVPVSSAALIFPSILLPWLAMQFAILARSTLEPITVTIILTTLRLISDAMAMKLM